MVVIRKKERTEAVVESRVGEGEMPSSPTHFMHTERSVKAASSASLASASAKRLAGTPRHRLLAGQHF